MLAHFLAVWLEIIVCLCDIMEENCFDILIIFYIYLNASQYDTLFPFTSSICLKKCFMCTQYSVISLYIDVILTLSIFILLDLLMYSDETSGVSLT